MDEPAFARSGASNPYGKCTEEAKTHVPEKVKDDLTALAVAAVGNNGAYLHDLIMSAIYGEVPDPMKKIAWDHVCNSTDSELIRGVMFTYIFGRLHEFRIANAAAKQRETIGQVYALNGGGK